MKKQIRFIKNLIQSIKRDTAQRRASNIEKRVKKMNAISSRKQQKELNEYMVRHYYKYATDKYYKLEVDENRDISEFKKLHHKSLLLNRNVNVEKV